jgi:hypothetical protein
MGNKQHITVSPASRQGQVETYHTASLHTVTCYKPMLCMVYIYALQVDAGRRSGWITPCKPQAQPGDTGYPPASELRRSSTLRGCRDAMHRVSTVSPTHSGGCAGRGKNEKM